MADVTTAILDVLNASCQECGIGLLKCFSNSSSYVTYRARLEGTSQADSLSLISLIEDWVESGGASIIVTGVILKVDSQCPVAISSLSEGECTTQQNLSDDSEVDSKVPITTIAISAGVLGLIILFIIVVIAAIKYYRQRCSK